MNAQEKTTASNELNVVQRNLVLISAFTSSGRTEQLKIQLNSGLDSGLSINEIKEALVQLYAYCGFPRSLNALNVFKTVLDERKSKGISDKAGKEIVVTNTPEDKYEQGRLILETLTGKHQPKPAPGFGEFAPRADAFLKEHLFGDIFSSDVLSYQQRELVTISALAAMPGVEPQLQGHIQIGKNIGLNDSQLEQLAELIDRNIGRTQANTVRKGIGAVLIPDTKPDMMVRISEIEIDPVYLVEYKTILQEESSASVKLEPGVIAIYPMFQKENPTQIRIVEIYADKESYLSHLQTPHFLHYKTSTLKMVKSLKLIDMTALDIENMKAIFRKM